MNWKTTLLAIAAIAIFGGCENAPTKNKVESDTKPGPASSGTVGVQDAIDDTQLVTVRTGEPITALNSNERTVKGPATGGNTKIVFRYRFFSGTNNSFQVVKSSMTDRSRACRQSASQQITLTANGETTPIAMFLVKLNPNTNYVLEFSHLTEKCTDYDVQFSPLVWMDSKLTKAEPEVAYACSGSKSTGLVSFPRRNSGISFDATTHAKFVGDGMFCGTQRADSSRSGTVKTSDVMTVATGSQIVGAKDYGYELRLDHSAGTGILKCTTDGKVDYSEDLKNCSTLLLDYQDYAPTP